MRCLIRRAIFGFGAQLYRPWLYLPEAIRKPPPTLMPFLWYYLQFHSAGWGLLPGQLRAFLSHHNPCGKHELILWLRWSLVEALLSQPSVTDTNRSTRIDWENSCQCSPMQHGFPCSSSFLCSYLCQWSCFLASICPPGPWTAAQCVSWWLQGLWGDFARKKKRGRGLRGRRASANTSCFVVHPNCPSAQQGKKRFPSRVPFVQLVVEGMSV